MERRSWRGFLKVSLTRKFQDENRTLLDFPDERHKHTPAKCLLFKSFFGFLYFLQLLMEAVADGQDQDASDFQLFEKCGGDFFAGCSYDDAVIRGFFFIAIASIFVEYFDVFSFELFDDFNGFFGKGCNQFEGDRKS